MTTKVSAVLFLAVTKNNKKTNSCKTISITEFYYNKNYRSATCFDWETTTAAVFFRPPPWGLLTLNWFYKKQHTHTHTHSEHLRKTISFLCCSQSFLRIYTIVSLCSSAILSENPTYCICKYREHRDLRCMCACIFTAILTSSRSNTHTHTPTHINNYLYI